MQGLAAWEEPRTASPAGEDLASCAPSTSYPLPPYPHHPHTHHQPQHHQLQQLRAYRIPYRVLLPKTPYSQRSGRSAPQPWPAFEALKAPPGELRWHRSVVRFPPEVTAELEGSAGEEGRVLAVSGKAGTIRISLKELDPTGLLAFRLIRLPPPPGSNTTASSSSSSSSSSSVPSGKAASSKGAAAPAAAAAASDVAGGDGGRVLLALVSPDKERFEAVGSALNSAIRGVMAGYLVGLTVKGVGYRMEPLLEAEGQGAGLAAGLTVVQAKRRSRAPDGGVPKPYYFEAVAAGGTEGGKQQAIAFPHNKPASAIRLKVGFSRNVVYPLPPHVRAFFLKPTLLYLYGLELAELQRVAAEVRSIRPPNAYTGNGVQYVAEVVRLKARKGAK